MRSLLNELRLATKESHERLHAHPALRDLTTEKLTLGLFRDLIKGFYGFYEPYETLYASCGHELLSAFPAMQKLQWLSTDLHSLHVDVAGLPVHVPGELRLEQEQVLAYLYLREGSNLGGQVISRHLEDRLSLRRGIENNFFWGNGGATGDKWNLFREKLSLYENTTDIDAVTSYAALLFERLEAWLSQQGEYR